MMLLIRFLQEGHGAAEGGGTPFSLEPGLIVWTWIVFIALLLLLRKFAWPHIVRATEERERTIRKQLDEAERLNSEAQAKLEEHHRLLAASKDQAHQLVNEAKALGEQEREQLLARTREEQEEMLERVKREIAAEHERAVADLRREAVDLSLAAASKLIQRRLENDDDRRIVEDYLAALEKQP
jgi:F-type H+-transporting ATPase subunit b